MNQPLAPAVGNALEVAEVLSVLRDRRPDSRLCDLDAGAGRRAAGTGGRRMLRPRRARGRSLKALQTGRGGREASRRMVPRMAGPASFWTIPGGSCRGRRWCARCRAERAGLRGRDRRRGAGAGGGRAGRRAAACRRPSIDPRVGLTRILRRSATAVARGTPSRWSMPPAPTRPRRRSAAVRAAIQIGAEAADDRR